MLSSEKDAQRVTLVRQITRELCPDCTLDEATELAVVKWLSLLEQWNHKIDLTAARTEHELLDLFLADALVLRSARKAFSDSNHWLDVGTGAGAPGLVLALLDPTLRVDLVEPNSKRVAFLRHSIGTLRLNLVTVHALRVENVTHLAAEDVVSRATLSPDAWLAAGRRLAKRRLWFLLGREPWSPAATDKVVYDRSYQWPLTGATRRVLAISA